MNEVIDRQRFHRAWIRTNGPMFDYIHLPANAKIVGATPGEKEGAYVLIECPDFLNGEIAQYNPNPLLCTKAYRARIVLTTKTMENGHRRDEFVRWEGPAVGTEMSSEIPLYI